MFVGFCVWGWFLWGVFLVGCWGLFLGVLCVVWGVFGVLVLFWCVGFWGVLGWVVLLSGIGVLGTMFRNGVFPGAVFYQKRAV